MALNRIPSSNSMERKRKGRDYAIKQAFINQLKISYENLCDNIKPIPFLRSKLCSIGDICVQGGVNVLVRSGGDEQSNTWSPLESHDEILMNSPKTKRKIIEGDPGYGKSTLLLWYLHDWCSGNPKSTLRDTEIVIYLKFRHLKGIPSIYKAIKLTLLPRDSTITEKDIKNIIQHCKSVVIFLDEYNEYPDKSDRNTDFFHIIGMEMFHDIDVIITTRTSNLPPNTTARAKRFRLTGFTKQNRKDYILKVVAPGNFRAADIIEAQLERNSPIGDLCESPLFFTMVAHIAHERGDLEIFRTATRFFRFIEECFHSHMRNKDLGVTDDVIRKLQTDHSELDRLAFEGLCGQQHQQLSWEKPIMVERVGPEFCNYYVRMGMLVEEEVFEVSRRSDVPQFMRTLIQLGFPHKIFCEYYASFYLGAQIASGTSVEHVLSQFNPLDLQYLYRFTCGLNKTASEHVIKYLQKTRDGRRFAVLCMLEQEENSEQFLQTVTDLVSGNSTMISETDTKLLQRSTIQILDLASANEIPITDLNLLKSFSNIHEGNIVLKSGLRLRSLSSLEMITIDGARHKTELSENDVNGLLNYGLQSERFKELLFCNCRLPKLMRFDVIPQSRNIKVMGLNDANELEILSDKWTKIFQNDFEEFKRSLAETLSSVECQDIGKTFQLTEEQLEVILNSKSPVKDLFNSLEEIGIVYPANIERLLHAFHQLEVNDEAIRVAELYQKDKGEETPYERFLAELSSHLTLSVPEKFCDYFQLTDEKKDKITSSQSPGLTFLTVLDEMGIIHQFDVSRLITPLEEFQLVQAVARLEAYQSLVEESMFKETPVSTLEAKKNLFLECLRKKIKSWYETMTPIPWKKSCKWSSSELFVDTCSLILTHSKSKVKVDNIDPHSKLNCKHIFTDKRLKSETRIIIEGDPGSGKTMLSSQLAYDWSIGKISEADMVVFLPLRFVEDMTIFEAIEKFYIPSDKPLNAEDIKTLLNQENMACLILDGYEEYKGKTTDGEASEVVSVMKKEKLNNCRVVLTSRSDFAHDLPECPMLKLGQFSEEQRDLYIDKVFPDNQEKQKIVRATIRNSAFLQDLCSSPLLFVFIVHNVEQFARSQSSRQEGRVGAFMQKLVNTLLSQVKPNDGTDRNHGNKQLGEIAFNGLCKGLQRLLWQKSFLDRTLPNMKELVESGILVVEEGLMVGGELQVLEEDLLSESGKDPLPERNYVPGYDNTETEEEISTSDDVNIRMLKQEQSVIPPGELQSFDSRQSTVHLELPPVGATKTEPLQSENDSDNELSKSSAPLQTHQQVDHHLNFDISLLVRFLHKIIQEWFAAIHISSMLKHSKDEGNLHGVFLNRHLPLINPADLHYVLRFTSYLCPEHCHLIMEQLLRLHKQEDGTVPEHVLNCISLCFAEVDSSASDKRMDKAVRRVCKNTVTIRGEDTRLLQQAKVSMLTYASNAKIHVASLTLDNVLALATEKHLILNSDLNLQCLPTVKSIEMSQWDQALNEEDYENVIRFIFKLNLLKEARFLFPIPPPSLTKEDISVMKEDLEVEWIIGSLVHTLDKKTGSWDFRRSVQPLQVRRCSVDAVQKALKSGLVSDQDRGLMVEKDVSKDGGLLSIPRNGVRLEIQPGALVEQQRIKMRIVTRYQEQSTLTFSSNTSPVIELLPNNLKLHQPALLTLPHCLVLRKGVEWKAKIYSSHHKEGEQPLWIEQPSIKYTSSQQDCTIYLENFCSIQMKFWEEDVEGKNIMMYAANTPDWTIINVGYYLDLPQSEELTSVNEICFLSRKRAVLLKKGEKPLQISFERTTSQSLQHEPEDENPKKIPFKTLAFQQESFCTFSFTEKDNLKYGSRSKYFFKFGQTPDLEDFIFSREENASVGSSIEPVTTGVSPPQRAAESSTSSKGYASVAGSPVESTQKVDGSLSKVTILDRPVDDETLMDIKGKMGREWKDVGRYLKVGDELKQLAMNNEDSISETIFNMLITWKQKNGEDATFRVLGTALDKAGRKDLQDIVYERASLKTSEASD